MKTLKQIQDLKLTYSKEYSDFVKKGDTGERESNKFAGVDYAVGFGVAYNLMKEREDKIATIYTCHNCKAQDTCEWAWDHYNTTGDCIAEK